MGAYDRKTSPYKYCLALSACSKYGRIVPLLSPKYLYRGTPAAIHRHHLHPPALAYVLQTIMLGDIQQVSFNSVLIGFKLTCIIRQMSEHNSGDALWFVARSALAHPT